MWHDLSRLAVASPPWLHWIIVTRADPPLGIQRLQLQGRLAQIRVTDLAFDVDEATTFMAWFGLDIPADAVRDIGPVVRGLGGRAVPGGTHDAVRGCRDTSLGAFGRERSARRRLPDRGGPGPPHTGRSTLSAAHQRRRPAHARARHAAHREHDGRASASTGSSELARSCCRSIRAAPAIDTTGSWRRCSGHASTTRCRPRHATSSAPLHAGTAKMAIWTKPSGTLLESATGISSGNFEPDGAVTT